MFSVVYQCQIYSKNKIKRHNCIRVPRHWKQENVWSWQTLFFCADSMTAAVVFVLCMCCPITEWQTGSVWLPDTCVAECWSSGHYSTDLNSSCKPIDFGRDPSFSFYFSPAAILRVNLVHTALFHRLETKKSNRQKHCEGMPPCNSVWELVDKHCPTMRRAWLMFHVSVVMVLFWGSTIESSMMYAELAMCLGR